jgi:hypothetical protein
MPDLLQVITGLEISDLSLLVLLSFLFNQQSQEGFKEISVLYYLSAPSQTA